MKLYTLIIAFMLLYGCAANQPKTPPSVTNLSEDEFNKQFRCPESYSDDTQRMQATDNMLKWYGAHYKNTTLASVISFRVKLLEGHNCVVTLQNIKSNETSP